MVLDIVISCDWKGRLPVETKEIRSVIMDPRASSEHNDNKPISNLTCLLKCILTRDFNFIEGKLD